MIRLKTVLVATDFSEPSAKALDYGRALARTFGATLHVLHVVENALAYSGADMGAGVAYASLQQELEEAARAQLNKAVRDDDRRELNARTALLTSSSPALTIASYARDTEADVIVIGTHGRAGLSHLLMGSVAEKVVRLAPCPVLTVRHAEHEFVLPDALEVVVKTAN
jgi:nucleotide-binding universal stress UspA family protein